MAGQAGHRRRFAADSKIRGSFRERKQVGFASVDRRRLLPLGISRAIQR
jgi:hypothetical protein